MSAGAIVAIVLASIVFALLAIYFVLLPKKVFFMALFSGAYIFSFTLISMRLRKENLQEIVSAFVFAKKSKLGLSLYDIENISLSGGHPVSVVEGLNAAKVVNLPIDFKFAKAIDIAGFDVLTIVKECVNPKVVELPLITTVAQDNIEVNVKVSLSLKVNVSNFLRGVNEETVSARAVESVVTKIANSENSSDLVSKPELIDKAIFDANIDDDAKYRLASADVIHIDIGKDHNLDIERHQIETERIISANRLEERRLTALALEQEAKVRTEEMRLKIAENEAQVPKTIAKAIEEGKIQDIIDYYKLQNLQADTEMRRKLTGKKDNN